MSKKLNYIGNIGGDTHSHIIRSKEGRLLIAKHHRAGDYIEFKVNNIDVAIAHTRNTDLKIRCTQYATRPDVTEAIEIAQFIFSRIKEQTNVDA